MSKSGTRVMITTAVAILAVASSAARALNTTADTPRHAAVDPVAAQQAAPTANTKVIAAQKKSPAQRKPAAAKAKILAGLNNFRSPARRALDHIKQSDRDCGISAIACPVALRSGGGLSQTWADSPLLRPSPDAIENPLESAPTNSTPALVRPHTDVPGLVPGRESSYKLSFNLPLGRYENVLLQANLRKNTINNQNTSDSTLRADWSLRF